MSKEVDVGRVYFSYTEERKTKKEEVEGPPRAFVPEACDHARLLPRLREAVRR